MSTIYKRIALHYAEARNGRGKPSCFLLPEAAQDMLDTLQAEWGNAKMSWLRLKKCEHELPKTARSLKPGLMVVEGFVAGNEGDVAIIEAWRFRCAA